MDTWWKIEEREDFFSSSFLFFAFIENGSSAILQVHTFRFRNLENFSIKNSVCC